jgi:hypothetical protein
LSLTRSGKMDPPAKNASGNFIWTPADIDRLRRAMRMPRRPRRKPLAEVG